MSTLLRARAEESRALKVLLRATWTRPMGEEQRHLARLRRRITDLCVLGAHLRGRFHLARAPRHHEGVWDRATWHADVAARVARELGLPPLPGPADAPGAPAAVAGGGA